MKHENEYEITDTIGDENISEDNGYYATSYGAQCPRCDSTDTKSDDDRHWRCNNCGHFFYTG